MCLLVVLKNVEWLIGFSWAELVRGISWLQSNRIESNRIEIFFSRRVELSRIESSARLGRVEIFTKLSKENSNANNKPFNGTTEEEGTVVRISEENKTIYSSYFVLLWTY